MSDKDIKCYQKLKRQGSEGQYRKALRMFNSRRVKSVKVFEYESKLFIKANIYRSFSNGKTRVAVILFRNSKPSQGYCECAVGISGMCCHVICILLYLEHFTETGTKFLSLTCTQKLQKWHRKGTIKSAQTRLCHIPLHHFRNLRSSRKKHDDTRTKKKVNKNHQIMNESNMEVSDWMKRDINHMVSKIEIGINGSQINVENHIYTTLQKYGLKSGLYGQLNYNYHYRVRQALQDHDYTPGLVDEEPLKPRFTSHKDTWHVPLQTEYANTNNCVTTCQNYNQGATICDKQKPMYEHIQIKQNVDALQSMISKSKTESKDPLNALHLTIPKRPGVQPFGFNYHPVQQNSDDWLKLRIGKVTCSSIGNLIGLSGTKEQLHILTCITNNIDPNKVKPKKFHSFARGRQYENEAREAFELLTGVPVSTCGYFTHLPETKSSNVFLIERNNLLLDVVKMVIDHMITNTTITSWAHDEYNLLKKAGECNINKVPTFASLKPVRAWIKKEARKIRIVHFDKNITTRA